MVIHPSLLARINFDFVNDVFTRLKRIPSEGQEHYSKRAVLTDCSRVNRDNHTASTGANSRLMSSWTGNVIRNVQERNFLRVRADYRKEGNRQDT
jgi:hypothetical protein